MRYSDKNLTYEEDVINAFPSILEDYSVRNSTRTCWGLPINGFPLALMWEEFDRPLRPRSSRSFEAALPS